MDDQILALKEIGVPAERIHSNLSEEQNKRTLKDFKNGIVKIL